MSGRANRRQTQRPVWGEPQLVFGQRGYAIAFRAVRGPAVRGPAV